MFIAAGFFGRRFIFTFFIFLCALLAIFTLSSRKASVKNTEPQQPTAMLLPAGATKTAALASGGDVDVDGRVDPGDTIQYTVTIPNMTAASGTGMKFTDTLESNLTLVPNSLNTTPIAVDDSFSVYGNVSISVLDGASDLLANDLDPDNGSNSGLTLLTTGNISSTSCAGCNNVSINANGSFSYDPPVGFTGTDSFTYTIRDNGADGTGGNADDATVTGTVSLNITGMIWFINNGAAVCTTLANQCGKLSKPFSTLDAFRAVNDNTAGRPSNNQDVFIYQSATGYTLSANLPLLSGQRFVGQDASPHNTPISNAAVLNLSLPASSAALPSTDTGNAAASISGGTVTANNNNTLRGVTLGNSSTLLGTNFGTLTIGDVTVNSNSQAMNLNNGTIGGTGFTGVTSTGGATNVSLTGIAGNLALGAGALSGASGNSLDIDAGNGAISYSGTIGNVAGRHVEITNKNGGTVTFSGALSGTGTGVFLNANTGSTINFAGGMTLSTGANSAFTATGGGTVNVCDENPCNPNATGALVNALTTTTGTALNVQNTTIGTNKLEFRSISVNGAANGIVLSSTGANGLIVSGTGTTAGSGGTIQNIANRGASFVNSAGITLKNMNFTNAGTTNGASPAAGNGTCGIVSSGGSNTACNAAIHLNTVTAATLNNLTIGGTMAQQGINALAVSDLTMDTIQVSGAGNENGEHGINLQNMSGTISLTAVNTHHNFVRGFQILNHTGTATLSAQNSQFNNNGGQGVMVQGSGTSNLTTTFNNCTIQANGAIGFTPFTLDPTTQLTVNLTNSTITGNPTNVSLQASGGNMDYTITGNMIHTPTQGPSLNLKSDGSGKLGTNTGLVQSNTIGTAANFSGGCSGCSVISLNTDNSSRLTGSVVGNTIQGIGLLGIQATTRLTSKMQLVITGNRIIGSAGINHGQAILAEAGVASGQSTCYTLTVGGTVTPPSYPSTTANAKNRIEGNFDPTSMGGSGIEFYLQQYTGSTFNLPGLSGSADAWLAARNDITSADGVNVFTSGSFSNGASCPSFFQGDELGLIGAVTNPDLSDKFCRNPFEPLSNIKPFFSRSADAEIFSEETIGVSGERFAPAENSTETFAQITTENETALSTNEVTGESGNVSSLKRVFAFLGDVPTALIEFAGKVGESVSPTVRAQESSKQTPMPTQNTKKDEDDKQPVNSAPESGELICVDADTIPTTCVGAGWTQPQGKTVTITFRAQVSNNPALPNPAITQVSNQGTVSGANFASFQTDGDTVTGGIQPTVTLIDSTTVAVASSADPTVFGQSVTFTATLTGSPSHATGDPTGTVQFKADGNNIGSPVSVVVGTLNDNASTASVSTPTLSVGNHVITAEYSGGGVGAAAYNANVGTFNGGGNGQSVNQASTSTGVASSQNPSLTGQNVTFTATIGVTAPGAGTPSGSVDFLDGSTVVCDDVAISGTTAQCSLSNLSTGVHTLTAQYNGDTNFTASSGSLSGNQTVTNTATWDGSNSTDWATGANWNVNVAPFQATHDVSIPAGALPNEPSISAADVTLNNLVVATGRTVTVGAGRTLNVNNLLNLNSGTLDVLGDFAVAGGTVGGTGTVRFSGAAALNIPAYSYFNLTINNSGGTTLLGNATVNGALNLTNGIVNTGANTLTVETTGSITRTVAGSCTATTNCLVNGNLRKNFNTGSVAAFTFHTGDADGEHAPVTATPSSALAGANLTVSTIDSTLGGMDATKSVSRYWSLSGSGLTTALVFTYRDADVNGNENNYRVWKKTGAATPVSQCASPCVTPAQNTVNVSGVNSFSEWTAGEGLAPTAASVEVSGRVTTANGRAIAKARVIMTDALGNQKTALTNPFGFFRFTNVQVGSVYIFTVSHKSYEFVNQTQILDINDVRDDIIFIATESFGEQPTSP